MKLFDSPAALLLILVVILLFGSKKLPDVARGVGRSLRIFKAETKGLMTDDEGQSVPPVTPPQIVGQPSVPQPSVPSPSVPQPASQPSVPQPSDVTATPAKSPETEKTES
jgi:sec-independent protein translocase protein TatA